MEVMRFWVQKLVKTQRGVDWCIHNNKSHLIKWANALKKSSKKFTEANTASHNNAKWHTDRKGFLEHPPSGGSLYYKGPTVLKIILVSFGYRLIHHHTQIHKHIQIYRYLNMHRQFSNQVSILVPPLLSILTWFILLFSHFISFLPHESFVCQQC